MSVKMTPLVGVVIESAGVTVRLPYDEGAVWPRIAVLGINVERSWIVNQWELKHLQNPGDYMPVESRVVSMIFAVTIQGHKLLSSLSTTRRIPVERVVLEYSDGETMEYSPLGNMFATVFFDHAAFVIDFKE